MKKVFILALMLLISVTVVHAVTQYKISIEPEAISLENPDQVAEFKLEIENQDTEAKHFSIVPPIDPRWSIQTKPLTYGRSGITIDGNTKAVVTLLVKPLMQETGYFGLNIEVKRRDEGVSKKIPLYVAIPEPSSRVYQPAIKTIVDIDEQQDPREPVKVTINLRNLNPLDIKDLRVLVRSDSQEGEVLFNDEQLVSLSPVGESGDQKEIVFTRKLDPLMEPTQDTIRVSLFYDNQLVEPTIPSNDIEFTGYSEIISESIEEKSFLKKVRVYTYVNDGNVVNSDSEEIRSSWLEKTFTKETIGVEVIKDGQGWKFQYDTILNPEETSSFTLTTNYRFPVILFVIIVLIILGYFVFRSPILVYKKVVNVHKKSDGHSEIKVQLHIKNRSATALESVRILDKVPSIAMLERVFHVGTLEPTKITEHDKAGTTIRWEIDEIDRFEERLIVYKIKTKLAVLGGFNLPSSLVRFKTPRGGIRRARSKPLQVRV